MPRKNNQPKITKSDFSYFKKPSKKRYASKFEAEKVAEYQMALDLNLELFVYQEIDGGWYLTRKKSK